MTFVNGTIIGGPHSGRVVSVNPGGHLELPVQRPMHRLERLDEDVVLERAVYRHHQITANGTVMWFWLPVEIEKGAEAIAFILNLAVRHSAT